VVWDTTRTQPSIANEERIDITIDPHMFTNGVITVQPGLQSELFHAALRSITHVY